MSVKCDEVPGYTAAFGQGTMSCLDTCQEHQRKVNAKAPLEAQEACNKDAKCGGLYDKGTLAPRGNGKCGMVGGSCLGRLHSFGLFSVQHRN